MANKEQRAKVKKGIGFNTVKTPIRKKLSVMWWMFWTDLRAKFGSHKNEAVGIRIGASVQDAQISIQVVMKYGNDVTVAMNRDAAKQIINELHKAIDMVKYRG